MEIAKKIAEGKKYKEINKEIQISQSRLSVLKSNPLFIKYVEKYRKMNDDGYAKALEELGEKAPEMGKVLVSIAENKAVSPQVRLNAANGVLDRVGMSTGGGGSSRELGQDEVSFEQILRITKKTSGVGIESPQDEGDYESAQKDLMSDLVDVTPLEEGAKDA